MKLDLRILRWRPSLFGCSGVADDIGVPGATTPQRVALPNSEPNRGNETHKVDSFGTMTSRRRLRTQQYLFFLLKVWPYSFYFTQALQSPPCYLNMMSSFQRPARLTSVWEEKNLSPGKDGLHKFASRWCQVYFGCVRLHGARISPTMGSAVLPAHLPPSQSKLTFIFKSSLCSKNV